MALTKFRPTPATSIFSPLPVMENLPNRLRRMFDDAFFGMEPVFNQTIGLIPPAEIVEAKDELILTLELPGMAKKDIEIAIDEGVLTIKGEKLELRKEGEEDRKYHLWERTYGTFTRSFTLPGTVDAEKIRAESKDGVLTIALPKKAEAKPRSIQVKVS